MDNDDGLKKWTHHDVKRGDTEAMECLRQDAEQGNADAQWRLGMCYLKGHGHGVHRDRQEAAKWFYHAAIQGHADAQYQLGGWYLRVRELDQNDVEAVKWFCMAAERGNKDATQKLPAILQRMEKVASLRKTAQERLAKEVEKYRALAEGGDAKAQYQLGLIYSGESKMFKEDTFRGCRSYDCGYFKYYETLPRRDYVKATKWFLKAAEQGHTEAQSKVIECYFDGTGVSPSPEKAMKWLRKAKRLLKRTELVRRLKTLAKSKPSQYLSLGTMCYVTVPLEKMPCPKCKRIVVVSRNDTILDCYNRSIIHVQRYGLDATLIIPEHCALCGSGLDGNVQLEINYPDQPDPIRVILESVFDLELMERFLSGTSRYKKERGEEYPLRDKISRLVELFGLELPNNAEGGIAFLWKGITKRWRGE